MLALFLLTCLSFAEPPAGSRCQPVSELLVWLNRPATAETAPQSRRYYDNTLHDPALEGGVRVSGDLQFDFRARGPHLVEIFVKNPEADRYPFWLEAGGKKISDGFIVAPGPGRMRPKRGTRHTSLIAVVEGPQRLTVKTTSTAYVLSAARWTPGEEFEKTLVPKWAERARFLLANVLLEGQDGGPFARRNYVQQLYDRLYHSRDPEMKKEAVIGLTRAWFWVAAENHEPDDVLRTRALFEEALRITPGDPIVRQMISSACTGQNVGVGRMPHGKFCEEVKPVSWEVVIPAAPADAPAWAVAQRRMARRMDAITGWWVERRQAPNGELGGGWGDDVEILRQWGPQALGLGSDVAARGVRRLADGLWNSGTLLHGYDQRISDVEHSSEPTTDTQPLFAALLPDSPTSLDRLKETAECAAYWIVKQADGRHRFRSSWFNCREADISPERAVDVHLNTRAMGPALWYAYLTRDARLVELLARWADSWIEAMRSTAHGKPAGIVPPVLWSADGAYLVRSDRWDKPDAEWDYFQWSGGSQEALASLMLAVHDLTGEARYLGAAGESFSALGNCGRHLELCEQMRQAPQAFYEWRRRTGDARYDGIFGYQPARPDAEILTRMRQMAEEMERKLGVNFDMFTSEVMYTDRVYYAMPPEYRQHLFGGETPRGDRYPTFAVTWPVVAGEFARAVLQAGEESLRVRAYNFEEREIEAKLRLWRLKKGAYRWHAMDALGRPAGGGSIQVNKLPQVVSISLPPRKEVTVNFQRGT